MRIVRGWEELLLISFRVCRIILQLIITNRNSEQFYCCLIIKVIVFGLFILINNNIIQIQGF